MNSSPSSVKLPGSSIVGTKRPAPSLLPAFEPSSSSPSLPRPTKRSRVSSLDDNVGNFPKSDPATSSTYIPSSSPPQLPNTRPPRPMSSFSERAPLSAVPSIELERSGDPTLMGRSSNSSHYQLSTNKLISRVHIRATYKAADHPAPRKIVVECLGWNGVKIHCQGKAWELRKGDSFTSETEDAGIIVDVQDARVLLLWPRHANAISTPTDSDSTWDDENSPRRNFTAGNRGSPFRSPLRQQHRLQSPVSPSPAVQASNSLIFNPPLPAPIQVYEDELPADEGLTGDVIAGEATQSTQHASQAQGTSPREPHSSPLSEPTGFSDADEENEPIVHSFGPFGLNLGARLESFTTNSPERRRPLQPIKEATASPQQRSSSESLRDDAVNPVINHVVNQLAYSRVSSTPLSTLIENLPTHLKSASPGSKENGDLTLEALKKMLDATRCIGEVSREGKDASGKALENEYYYIPDLDTEEKRREAVVDGLRKPGLRACRKQHKVGFVFYLPVSL